jgi:hypothetical protein
MALTRKPLHHGTAHLFQKLQLFSAFHTLGQNLQMQALAHLHDGIDNGGCIRVVGQIGHERAVDLEPVYGVLAQIGQRRVAGTEIIDRQSHAKGLEGMQSLLHLVAREHQRGFCDLDVQIAGVQPRVGQCLCHFLDDIALAEFLRRQVDCHRDGGKPCCCQARA